MNERGTGSAQYHPRMMLALLVYCYANGIFGSRRIERATYRDIGVRYVAANCHPDHDTICTFRRSNFRCGGGGVPAGTAAGEGAEAAACWNGERGRHEGGRECEQAQQHPLRTGRGRCASSCEARSRGCWIRRSTPTRTRRRTRRVCRRNCRGGTSCGRSWTVRARSWKRRAQARADSERAEYERKVAARERRRGSRKGRAHQAADGSAGGEGADQPDGRRQCADGQEPAP